ncbi:AAA family ATPase [Maridesulfovibrio sp.]|uniref:AAA family ATPase n=1 Tax=Maridesulfovibrio sp. TaxID=2795000 RepID=UPI0029CA6A0C|nr:AAA family ATPase [Maridesulfovibrio sp.]
MYEYQQLMELMKAKKISQSGMGRKLGYSSTSMCHLIKGGKWPKGRDKNEIKEAILDELRKAGAEEFELMNLFGPEDGTGEEPTEEKVMLLRKQGLFPEAKRHFGLVRNPFDEVNSPEDVFLSSDIRYVREAMYHSARQGGLIAVVGESGSGKSTLRKDLHERVRNESKHIHIIEPYVLAMEDNDKKGKSLKSLHIAEAIMEVIDPTAPLKSSPEARFRQLHTALRESSRAGYAHCLIIEEAHALPIPTIKHLKRFLELEDGFLKLMSIILLGQSELRYKLSETNPQVREVVQRCEMIELPDMSGSLPEYVKFRFDRIGKDATSIITAEAMEALRDRLTGPAPRSGSKESVSLVYPLAVGNLLTAAMNLAANIGAPSITPEIIKQV